MLSTRPAIRVLTGVRADTERGEVSGWAGRVAIHPSRPPVLAEVCRAVGETVNWAK
jgi:citrate lyase beta subunit